DESIHSDVKQSELATDEDWYKEYLGNELSIKIVPNYISAIEHINQYVTEHSEEIITENKAHANAFLQGVDALSVYHNASSRLLYVSEFGDVVEMGISTKKIHACRTMGLQALTSNKFIIKGQEQIRN